MGASEQRGTGDWFGRVFVVLLIAACLVLSVLVVRLSARVEQLNGRLRDAINRPATGAISMRESMSELVALDASGAEVLRDGSNVLALRDGRLATVLIAVGGACPVCHDLMPVYEAWATRLDGAGVVVTAVQVDAKRADDLKPAPAQLATAPLATSRLTTTWVADSESSWLRRIDVLPTVLVLDGRGEVRGIFKGEMDPGQVAAMETLLEEARRGW
jgi:thiol-disulfide isomerase/thioredoxin